MGRWAIALLVGALALAPRASAGDGLTPAPGVESGTLANGVRFVVVERDVSRGAVWLTINAGSMDEPPGRNGVAELAMRLSLRAPAHFEPGEVERLFRPTDAVYGRERHGVTAYDRTMFMLGLAGRGAGLDEALLFCADVLGDPAWDPALIERERASIEARARLVDRTPIRVQDELLERIAPGCAAVGHWPGGTAEHLKEMDADDARSFRRAWYTPGNATVVVVSAESAPLVAERVAEALGGIPGRATADRMRPEPDLSDPPELTVVANEGLSRAAAGVVRLGPTAAPATTADDVRAALLDDAVCDALTRQLEQDRRDRSLVGSSVRAESREILGTLHVVQAGADGPGEDALGMVRGVHRAVTRAVQAGTDAVAQQAAWRRVRDRFEEWDRDRDASTIARWFADRAFRGDALVGPGVYAREADRLAQEVSPEAFDRRLGELFTGSGVMTVVQSAVPLDEGAVRRAIRDGQSPIEPIEFPLADASRVFEPSGPGGSVVELTRHAGTGVTSAWLGSGVLVMHKHTGAVPGRVHVRLTLAGGALEEADGTRGLTAASVGALQALAVRGVPSVALGRALEKHGVALDAGGDVDSMHVTLDAAAGSIGEAMGVVRAVLAGPVVEPGAVEAWRDRFELIRARDEREAYRGLANEVRRAWLPDEARLMPLTRAQADAIEPAAVQAWVDRHASAPAVVVIVGDVPWHEALDAAADMLGGLEGRPRIDRGSLDSARGVGKPEASVRREVALELAEGAAAVAWGVGAPSLDEIGRVRAIVAGSWVLSERLKAELVGPGEAGGAALAAWAGYREDNAFDLYSRLEAVIVTDPSRVDEMIARAEAIAIELSVDGPSAEELEAFKERADELVARSMEDPRFVARSLADSALRGRPLDDFASMLDDYASLTARGVRDEMHAAVMHRPRLEVIVRPGESD